MKPLLEVRNLVKAYTSEAGSILALNNVTTTIEQGEFVAVTGPSGSGKSTFMNVLGCLDRPTSGEYHLSGLDVSAQNAAGLARLRNRRFGFVFQSFNLLLGDSALANVELPMAYSGVPRHVRLERAKELLDQMGLRDRHDHKPTQLSGGQQQRVAIARALANNPSVILADEPTGALDSATSAEIMELLGSLNAEGVTIVIVTHDLEVAGSARRVLSFRDGCLVEDRNQQARGAWVRGPTPAVCEDAA